MPRLSLPHVLSSTETEKGSACYRKHAIGDMLERHRGRSIAQSFGTVIHEAAAERWRSDSVFEAMKILNESWEREIDAHGLVDMSKARIHTRELAEHMIEEYFRSAGLAGSYADDDWELHDVENRFRLVVNKYIQFSVQADRVLMHKDKDRIAIIDIKTASPNFINKPAWSAQWERSLQMKLYIYGCSQFYRLPIDHLEIEGLGKKNPMQIKYESCPEWTPAQIAEAYTQFLDIASRDVNIINMVEQAEGVDKQAILEEFILTSTPFNYGNCHAYFSDCPYLTLCTADPADRMDLLHENFSIIPREV